MLVSVKGGTHGESGEKAWEQGENQQQIQPTDGTEQESNPGHIGERRALSPLRQPWSPTHISTRVLQRA